jgi:GNAT superfamily N-acetyltransferase
VPGTSFDSGVDFCQTLTYNAFMLQMVRCGQAAARAKVQAMTRVVTAQRQDIPAWLDLAAEVEPLFGPMVDDPGFYRALERNVDRGTAFCVREGDGPPGAPLLGGLLFSPKPPLYTIGWLAITAQHRRCGIGQSLVAHVVRLVEAPAEFVVTTFGRDHPEGEPARRFYERMGFHAAEPAPDGPEGGSRQIFRRTIR